MCYRLNRGSVCYCEAGEIIIIIIIIIIVIVCTKAVAHQDNKEILHSYVLVQRQIFLWARRNYHQSQQRKAAVARSRAGTIEPKHQHLRT